MTRLVARMLHVVMIVGLLAPRVFAQDRASDSAPALRSEALDISAVRDLLHLINTIIVENPGYEATVARLDRMEPAMWRDSVQALMQRNARNPRIAGEVDALLATPAYRLYYQQFRPASPDAHRKFFFGLPYFGADGPGGVGDLMLELCRNHRAVEEWYEGAIARVSMDRSLAVAREWLPPGEYSIPKTYFIYDGMGDAFVRDGMVCYDLRYVLSKRPAATRFEDLGGISSERIERVLAHEFHHAFASAALYPEHWQDGTWQERWKNQIRRGLVSEGLAMQCDPREGLEKAVRQDSTVIRYWIAELNEKLAAIDSGRTSDSAMELWWGDSFHAPAETLRREFLARRFPDENLDSLVLLTSKPDLVHTLGWWMVSHISDGGNHQEEVIRLLSDPRVLFGRYNVAIGNGDPRLLIAVDPAQ